VTNASVAFDVAEEVIAVLNGELPRYAVNAPALPPDPAAEDHYVNASPPRLLRR